MLKSTQLSYNLAMHVLVSCTATSVFIPLPLNFIPKLKLKQILVGHKYHLYIYHTHPQTRLSICSGIPKYSLFCLR